MKALKRKDSSIEDPEWGIINQYVTDYSVVSKSGIPTIVGCDSIEDLESIYNDEDRPDPIDLSDYELVDVKIVPDSLHKESISIESLLAYIDKRIGKVSQKQTHDTFDQMGKICRLAELDKLRAWVLKFAIVTAPNDPEFQQAVKDLEKL